jgi:hypothetical protein
MAFFNFALMAYTRHNYIKWIRSIVSIYNQHKEYDVPDTQIVKNIFPKHNIFISYRTWVRIKGTPLAVNATVPENQLSLFN